jgi:hypothetical protein
LGKEGTHEIWLRKIFPIHLIWAHSIVIVPLIGIAAFLLLDENLFAVEPESRRQPFRLAVAIHK